MYLTQAGYAGHSKYCDCCIPAETLLIHWDSPLFIALTIWPCGGPASEPETSGCSVWSAAWAVGASDPSCNLSLSLSSCRLRQTCWSSCLVHVCIWMFARDQYMWSTLEYVVRSVQITHLTKPMWSITQQHYHCVKNKVPSKYCLTVIYGSFNAESGEAPFLPREKHLPSWTNS